MYAITFAGYLLVPTLVPTVVLKDMINILVITSVVGGVSLAAVSSRINSLKQIAEQAATLEKNRDLLVDEKKMEAVARISAGVGHEFKNILRRINDHAESVERRSNDPAVEIANRVLQATGRASRMTEKLLSFSEQQLLNPALVEIGMVMKQREEKIRSALRPGVTLDLRNTPEPKILHIDVEHFCDAIEVLVRKAAENIPEKGTVRIRTRSVRLQQGEDNRLAAGTYCEFIIGNSGPPPIQQDRISVFEPFFTLGEFGTGDMNLAAVYGIVRQSGGQVETQVDRELGSIFVVMVPIQTSES